MEAAVTTKQNIGLTSNTFKERFTGHKASFTLRKYAHKTTLSSQIWELKDEQTTYNQHWSILSLPPSYSKRVRICHLCLMEKTHISLADPRTTLNKMKLLPSAATGTRCIFNTGDFSPCYLRINCQLHTTTNKNPPPCPTANFLV